MCLAVLSVEVVVVSVLTRFWWRRERCIGCGSGAVFAAVRGRLVVGLLDGRHCRFYKVLVGTSNADDRPFPCISMNRVRGEESMGGRRYGLHRNRHSIARQWPRTCAHSGGSDIHVAALVLVETVSIHGADEVSTRG